MSVVHPTVTVRGRFVTNTGPLRGRVTFTPAYLVIDPHADELVATIARSVRMMEGLFEIELTAETKYQVEVPFLGKFFIRTPKRSQQPLNLSELMPKHTKRK